VGGLFALFDAMTTDCPGGAATTREVNRLKSTTTTTTTFEPQITFAMAEPSGVTEAGLKAGLEERIGATHVEIEDMSGRQCLLPSRFCSVFLFARGRYCDLRKEVPLIDCIGGCGQAFSAIIVSRQFDKKTTLARHRLVNSALKTEIAAIHAWTPKCYTPEQWEQQKGGAVAPGKATTGEVVTGTRD